MLTVLPRLGAGACMEHCAKTEILSHVMTYAQFILPLRLGDAQHSVHAQGRTSVVHQLFASLSIVSKAVQCALATSMSLLMLAVKN
ncbi:hypothetical protein SPRG_01376 [Saprolegnia parasitica CBS 223.65]|uniref:Uncharacterized protein n=1 Tax=Saprolegnia parasitica (strain CBS 223.65) TaxID=695850 RepID=A0A067D523_SAPPC|nr:hypothetical protein SPRG_01376 [Saprolegnia parasitica CBS 223.65]KDO34102.1 hypothetical protein SPRG_01376 [Saprolegnia parasitica CBS 223.65]|eukprot:XP_012194985.1 hypothetical protein SPRG_01376 [Saprolegnia parasitica CBS 223.65]